MGTGRLPSSAAAAGRRSLGERRRPRRAPASAPSRRGERVEHRLVAELGLAAGDDALDPARSALTTSSSPSRPRRPGRAHLQEERPVQRPAGTADAVTRVIPTGFSSPMRRRPLGRRASPTAAHAPVHVGAVVGVADGGVELGQVVAVSRRRGQRTSEPTPRSRPTVTTRRHRHTPHRSAGVFTGASHSASARRRASAG